MLTSGGIECWCQRCMRFEYRISTDCTPTASLTGNRVSALMAAIDIMLCIDMLCT